MNKALKIISIILSIFTIVSLISSVHTIAFRIQRSDWVITDAEITHIDDQGGVTGTFTGINGTIYTEQLLYIDLKFAGWGLYKPQFPPIADYKRYIGKAVRIMYDPNTLNSNPNTENSRWINIESYDKNFIVSVSAFGVSTISLIAALVVKFHKKTTSDFDKKA